MKLRKSYYSCIATAGLLLVLGILNQFHLTPEDAADYHKAVRDAVNGIPLQVGPWQGRDEEVVQEAVEILRPNVIFSRRYIHEETGESVSLLVVHCKDARDLLSHYPPICYPSQGWDILWSYQPVKKLFEKQEKRADWAVYPMTHRSNPSRQVTQIAYHRMYLPNGEVTTDMDRVHDFAGNYLVRHYGAAQVQIILNEGLRAPEAEAYKPLLDALAPFEAAIASQQDRFSSED